MSGQMSRVVKTRQKCLCDRNSSGISAGDMCCACTMRRTGGNSSSSQTTNAQNRACGRIHPESSWPKGSSVCISDPVLPFPNTFSIQIVSSRAWTTRGPNARHAVGVLPEPNQLKQPCHPTYRMFTSLLAVYQTQQPYPAYYQKMKL